MTIFREGDLEIEFPDHAAPRRFDDPATHKLTRCMKAVDCIFEWNGNTYFLEIKDPDNPSTRTEGRENFLRKFQSDILNNDLKYKYRDSFLYEYASGRVKGEVKYVVLLCMKSLDSSMLMKRGEDLKKGIPLEGPDGPWRRPFAAGCAVLNIDSWTRQFREFPIRRRSEQAAGA